MSPLLSTLRGVIDRRVLINFRIEPRIVESVIPAPFEPQTIDGYALGGLCYISLRDLRPSWLPLEAGLSSENQAHQFPIQWTENGDQQTGVYIPHRHSDSWINRCVSGRAFPGVHFPGSFEYSREDQRIEVTMDGTHATIRITASPGEQLPAGSVFDSIEAASTFVEADSIGVSPAHRSDSLESIELVTDSWEMTPLEIESVHSSFLEQFPDDTYTLDHGLWMESIPHSWRRPAVTDDPLAPSCQSPTERSDRSETHPDDRREQDEGQSESEPVA